MKTTIELACDPPKTPRTTQISGMFDVPLDQKLTYSITADLPVEGIDWSVGVITGPSGAGKSSLIRDLWPDAILGDQDWSGGALADCFPQNMSIKEITGLLSSVGLSTVPAWCKPFGVLSNGEKFRATVARGLAETTGLLVIDEYGAFVDVQVGKVVSVALAKAVRRAKRQLVAVTCRGDDFAPWLEADWLYRVDSGEFGRSVQPRPRITVEIGSIDRAAWRIFARHHYMSAELSNSAQCFGAWCDGTLAGFVAFIHQPHAKVKNVKRITRTVVLPDWQGMGLGLIMSNWLGQDLYTKGFRLRSVTAHPVQAGIRARSPRWRECGAKPRLQVGPKSQMRAAQLDPRRLSTRVFEYVPPRVERLLSSLPGRSNASLAAPSLAEPVLAAPCQANPAEPVHAPPVPACPSLAGPSHSTCCPPFYRPEAGHMNAVLAISAALGGLVAFVAAVTTIVRAITRQVTAAKANEAATVANTQALVELSGKLDHLGGTVGQHGERIASLEGRSHNAPRT